MSDRSFRLPKVPRDSFPEERGRYRVQKLNTGSVDAFAAFLLEMRKKHWSLTSSAYQRKPAAVTAPSPEELIRDESSCLRIGTFLLFRGFRIVGALQLDYTRDRTSVIFSNAEADVRIQRRGIFAMCLGRRCVIEAMKLDVQSFEMTTWAFNRKAFPLYAKAGFRIVPRSSVRLVNFLPRLFRDFSDRFDGCVETFLDDHLSGILYGRPASGTIVVYPYEWRGGLRRNVLFDSAMRDIRIFDPDAGFDQIPFVRG